MSKEFKAGDKVYYPIKSTKVLTIRENDDSAEYPILVNFGSRYTYTFTIDGKSYDEHVLPSIFHATPENKAKLEDLHGVEFEKPPIKPSSLDIIKVMLNRGDELVPCWVSDQIKEPNEHCHLEFIKTVKDDKFYNPLGGRWLYATPFNPSTGEAITELPNVESKKSSIKPSSSDIIQAMLTKGNKYIPCWLSDEIKEPDSSCICCFVIDYSIEDTKFPFVTKYMAYRFATPFDPVTGKAITELPE